MSHSPEDDGETEITARRLSESYQVNEEDGGGRKEPELRERLCRRIRNGSNKITFALFVP